MSHPFGDLLTHYLHRKHGLSQAKLAAGILQAPSIISEMCQGKRLNGPQACERVTAIIGWLQQQGALTSLDEANALLNAAGMAPLQDRTPDEMRLIRNLSAQVTQRHSLVLNAQPPQPRPSSVQPRHNLPAQLTPFIGRAEQIAQLVGHLQTRRLLTLTGAGGVGKTRLSIEVATRLHAAFADGVWFVDLAPLTDPEALPQRILDLWRVPEQSEATPLATLIAYLSTKQTLLILDNCEHLIGACAALVETLLQHCPKLVLLATSREALNIHAELPWRVPSLTRPRAESGWDGQAAATQPHFTPEALSRFEAVTLFVARAHLRQPGFALTMTNASAVAQICSRLDGIPLALEMAAARVNIFTVEEMARRLDGAFDSRFQFLTSGVRTAPLRHQTLHATLEWSYTLLPMVEQRLLTRLSVFHGGWTLAAAEEVAGAALDRLSQLVNKSLVIADQQGGQTRYRLLETVRQFGMEQLRLDEQAQQQSCWQHSRYYLRLLGEQEVRLQSQQQPEALTLIRSDFANISAAWQWAVERDEFALLTPAVHALFLYCDVTGTFRTGKALFAQALIELQTKLTNSASQSTLQLLGEQLLVRLGVCEVMLTDIAQGEQHLHDVLLLAAADRERALALLYLGLATSDRGDLTLAHRHLQESLAISQRCGDVAGMADALHRFAEGSSDYPVACSQCAESLALWRQLGRPDRIARVINYLAWNIWCAGDYPLARAYWREGLALCEQLDLPLEKAWLLDCIGNDAWIDNMPFAEQCVREALAIYTELGHQRGIAFCHAELGWVLTSVGQVEAAIASVQKAVAIARAVNSQMVLTLCLNYLGVALMAAGDLAAARTALTEAIQRAWAHRYLYNLMNAFYYVAEWLVLKIHALDRPGALEHQALAVTTLSCVRTQTVTWQFFKDKATQLQAEIEESLPADLCTTAIARGQSCTLEEMVNVLLAEVDNHTRCNAL
ncbi:MAG: AAA family ATPase [Caldilineaceae bacterium]